MQTYFSTFIVGLSEVVKEALLKTLPDAKITLLLDGLAVFSTATTIGQVKSLRFFNNTFIMLNQIEVAERDSTASIVKKLYTTASAEEIARSLQHRTFRLVISRENQLTSINKEIIKKIEAKVINETDFVLSPLKADNEFWFLIRREGVALYGIRLTTPIKEYEKGELKTELAHLLCLLSEPNENDIVLDPFAGSGAIPLERTKAFPYKEVIAYDRDVPVAKQLKLKFKNIPRTKTLILDARDLSALKNETVNKIITDPPWGNYTLVQVNFVEFYTKMLSEFHRVLQPGGLMIIITARKEDFDTALAGFSNQFILETKYNILVSGKKVAVYKMRKS